MNRGVLFYDEFIDKNKVKKEILLILKEKFETDIINAIGEDKFQILKQCLSENWFQK